MRELARRSDVTVTTRAFGRGDKISTLARDGLWYPFLLGRTTDVDVLHCPTYRGPLRSRTPLVVTVHDLAVLRHPDAFNRWTRTYSPLLVPRVLAAARRVIAVSEFTRRELIELLHIPADKIHVVPNAVGEEFTREGDAETGRLRPRGRNARAAQESRTPGRGGAQDRQGAARGRCPRLGRRRRRRQRRALAGRGRATPSWRGSIAVQRASRTPRCTRASGFRSWRRWRAARRW